MAAETPALEHTRWHVTAIGGRATPARGDYQVEFEGGRIGGRFGCNRFGGPYSIVQQQLVARDIMSTLMGCPEPAASFESSGLAVLREPMQMSWTSGRQLTLSNSSGSIALEQLP